jgi:hypothetical protein
MSMSLEGLTTVGGDETRALTMLKVIHNGQTYDWQRFIPPEMELQAFLETQVSSVKAEIDAKEAEWAALTPKTREVEDPITGETITVPIEKSEIVRPEIPDYYAKRRAAYPTLGEQMDALWKGGEAAEVLHQKVLAVKSQYPKPSWQT